MLTERITIKVHPTQKKRFQELAEANGMNESEYGRSVLFQTNSQPDQRLLKQIGNIVGLIAQRIGISAAELTAIVKGTHDR